MPRNMPEAHKDKRLTCGSCKWFETPYRNKTCKESRKVTQYTRACEEYEKGNYTPEIESILSNPFFIKMNNLLSLPSYRLSKQVEREVRSFYFSSIKKEKFNHRFDSPNRDMCQLSKLFEKTQTYRDRLNEISIDITDLLNRRLYPLQNITRGKILTSFGSVLSYWKNAEDRNSIIYNLTERLERRISRCNNILEIAEMAIKNMDQTAWCLKSIKEIGEGIITRRLTNANIYYNKSR